MDTIENEAPAGSNDVTSSSDTANQVDTQPESPKTGADDTTEDESGSASEPLLAGKYKNPQELVKAYKDLDEKLGQLGQKAAAADLLQERYGVTPEQLKEIIDQQEQERIARMQQENPLGYVLQRQAELEGRLALQNEEKELDGFLAKNPEYSPFRDKILNIGLNLDRDKSYEDIANEYFGQARADGQKDAYKKIEIKKETQATGVQSVPQKKFSLEDMKKMSVKELEAILPHAQTP